MNNNINICAKGKVKRKKGVQICNSDVCIKKFLCLSMVRGWSIIFCCGGLVIMSKEYLLNARGLICKCLGRSWCNCFSTSLRCSVSCMRERHICIIQAYIICQRCLLSVNRSCPESFPTNWPLVRGRRECRGKPSLHWGSALGKPAGSYARGKGASAACLRATVTLLR